MTLPSRHRIRELAVCGRARYLSVTEAPHSITFLRVSLKREGQIGARTLDLQLSKQAVRSDIYQYIQQTRNAVSMLV